jgi:hypothetical protein
LPLLDQGNMEGFGKVALLASMHHPSQKSLSKRPVNTSTSKGSLFFAPKLREPH